MLTLETERTILRPLTVNDCAAVQRWASVPENVTHMPWGPNTDEETMKFLKDCEQSWAEDPVRKHELGIVLKDTGELIGACGIYIMDDLRTAELGWILRRDHWRKGIMSEVAAELLRYSFETRRVHRVLALCNADNSGSWGVMAHNGMRREAHYIKCRRLRNVEKETWVDAYEYAILAEEYFRQQAIHR